MNFPAPRSAKARRAVAVTASAATALSLILGSAFTATGAQAVELPSPSLEANVSLGKPAVTTPTDRFIVKFEGTARGNPGERGNAYGKAAKKRGVSVKEVKTTANGAQVVEASRTLSPTEVNQFVGDMNAQANVDYAEPDALLQITSTPNDTFYSKQWNLFEDFAGARVSNLWDKTTGAGQVVAVIDTGITAHSDLDANILPGYDMISDVALGRDGNGRDANPQDEGDYRNAGDCGLSSTSTSSWHGTHVAGTIAAIANNGKGVSGVAPGAKVVPVRALGNCGGYMSDIADGIIWASGGTVAGVPANANPAKSINLSLGGASTCSVTTQNAINTAVGRGAAVFVAAGNENTQASNNSPANCNNVITVAATGREGNRASYSNYGSIVDIAAPGGDMSTGTASGIASTVNSGTTVPGVEGYSYMQGTSMATPHVAGIAALMFAADPSLTPAQIENRLKTTSRAFPGTCAEGCGAGLVDASAAVIFPTPVTEPAPVPSPTTSPEPTPAPTPAPTVVTVVPVTSATPTISGTAKVGYTLTANPGTWGPAPVTLAYQWKVAGAAVTGATKSTYAVQPADAGKTITVTVTGAKDGYSSKSVTSASSATVATGTLTTANPVITGTAKVGYRLTANPGTWGPAPVTLSYQWYRSGVAITGATASSYVLTATDKGKVMAVRVTGKKTGYTSVYRQSSNTVSVAAGTLKGSTPTISGTSRVAYTLTANPGTWTSGTTVYYQWYRNGIAISGATAKSYKLVTADRGYPVKVRVTGVKAGYISAAYYSASTARIV